MFTSEIPLPAAYRGRRVTILGLGRFGGGVGATRFFCRHGARVTVTDRRPAEDLAPSLRALEGLPVRFVLGRHDEDDLLGSDLVVPSPAVARNAPLLGLCGERGIPLETEMNLFFKLCRGPICAVTGSNGKTTTTTLIADMLGRERPRVRVGGNLGRSLLPEVEAIAPEEWTVLELSSFQLEDLAGLPRRPEVSVVTNLTPNHLDRHGSFEAYARAKREILRGPGVAVLNGDDARVRGWAAGGDRHVVFFGRTGSVRPRAAGVWLDDEGNVSRVRAGRSEPLFRAADCRLRGRFNVLNAAAAAAAALATGAASASLRASVREFSGVSHRLQLVGRHAGVEYFNDSIATTPESTIAALEALGPEVLLICGGASKGCSFDRVGEVASRRAREVFLIGATAAEIERALRRARRPARIHRSGDLPSAVRAAMARARPGQRVLLSPACPSYDQFINFEERGRRFEDLVRQGSGRPA